MNRLQPGILSLRRPQRTVRWYSVPGNQPASPTSRLSLIPGTMCDNRLWKRMLPAFAQANILVAQVPLWEAVDRSSMQQMITQSTCSEALHNQNLPIDILGFSMGGYLALDYYFRTLENDDNNNNQQSNVRSLIIVCSSARGLGPKERARRTQMLDLISKHAYAGISPSRIAKFVKPGLVDSPQVGGLVAAMDRALGKQVLLTQFSSTLDRDNLMDRLTEVRIPVLIVGAELDQMVDAKDLYMMQERIKGSKLVMFKDAGHMIALEAPERLASIVLEFISGL
ncbi:Alpha/Beta hydrolase protein [Lipomyces chichibuensis]|uniref:Alpha/Beta hydrolase protein n=1 Tax=Lipomyces chichibuensis TaxID=1546026 RepID=UPI003343F1E5